MFLIGCSDSSLAVAKGAQEPVLLADELMARQVHDTWQMLSHMVLHVAARANLNCIPVERLSHELSVEHLSQ